MVIASLSEAIKGEVAVNIKQGRLSNELGKIEIIIHGRRRNNHDNDSLC